MLNAKQHEREAEIVLEAGHKGKVTIATNMAGRGTDIKLGEGVRELGGLHIIGTERHESRRIDNQLRGRAGRQGDPGSSRFYLALDDDLMRLFGSDRLKGIMEKLGLEDGMAIENKMVSNAIEKSQTRVEGHHYEIRKQLLEYDDVMNQQREAIYGLRRELMESPEVEPIATEYAEDLLEEILEPALDMKGGADKETEESVRARLEEVFNFERFPDWGKSGLPDMEQANKWVDEIFAYLRASTSEHYQEILRYFLLDSLDRNWKEHLLNMDHLRDGIGLRGYGQKDPKQEYKREGFELFSELIYTIKENALRSFSHLRIQAEVSDDEFKHEETDDLQYTDSESAKDKKPATVRKDNKISRNAPCPCGSGKNTRSAAGPSARQGRHQRPGSAYAGPGFFFAFWAGWAVLPSVKCACIFRAMFRALAISALLLAVLLAFAPRVRAQSGVNMGNEPGFLVAAPTNVSKTLQLQGGLGHVAEADFTNGLGSVSVMRTSLTADYSIFRLTYGLSHYFKWAGKDSLGRRFGTGGGLVPWETLQDITLQGRLLNDQFAENWRYWVNAEVNASYEKVMPGAIGVGFDGGVAYDFWDGWMLGLTARTVALSALNKDLFGDLELGLAVAVSQKTLRRTLQSVGLLQDAKPGSDHLALNFAISTQEKTYGLAPDNQIYNSGYLSVVRSKVGVYLDYLPNKSLTFSVGPEYHYNRKYKLYNKTGSYQSSHDLDNALGGFARILWRF